MLKPGRVAMQFAMSATPAFAADASAQAGTTVLVVLGTLGVLAYLAWVISATSRLKKKPTPLELASAAYQESLARLKQDPVNADLRQEALRLGREYSNLTRSRAGVTVYDELALSNDINAACAAAAAAPAHGSVEPPKQRLERLEELRKRGLITEQEYQTKRAAILADL